MDQCKCLPFNIRLKETVCKFYYFNSSIPEIYICQDEVCITDEELNCTENVINQPLKSKCLEQCSGLQVTSYEMIPISEDLQLNEIISNLSQQYNQYISTSMDFGGNMIEPKLSSTFYVNIMFRL